jgi:hypothetical protein
VALGPVVAGARLAEDEVVRTEDLAVGPGANRVHGAGLQVDEDGPGDVLSSGGFVVVDVDTLQLESILLNRFGQNIQIKPNFVIFT